MSFIVGIDLGTTNCAVAYTERETLKADTAPKIKIFEVPQLVRPGAVESRPLLPSFMYLPAASELPAGSTDLPWDAQTPGVITGELARTLGAQVPGRLVASAKSWLCSPSVDRTAAILPWGAPEDVKRVSPVEASARYLAHIRAAWNHTMARGDPALRLEKQDVAVTVPASFDEAARELTVEAARLAGLPEITLLEEPQAAFYAWTAGNLEKMRERLGAVRRVLVCDAGGGTTDFSLIDAEFRPGARADAPGGGVTLTRSAAGDHLMLGGDNMDLALARFLEKKFPGHLDAHQFKSLTAAARAGKERIFGGETGSALSPEKVPMTLIGRGRSVVSGTLRAELTHAEAEQVLLEGFFPRAKFEDDPALPERSGIREWGLPYVRDPAVTRHLGQFLRRHLKHQGARNSARPDAVLFNGGAMKPGVFRARILEAIGSWFGQPGENWTPAELAAPSLDLAVAIGAAYYGCVRRGAGLRIGGGMGRSYYIGVETDLASGKGSSKAALCLVPQGTEEGAELEMPRSFILRLATPVVFPLFSSSVRAADTLGTLVSEEAGELAALPPLETILHGGRHAVKKDVTVRLLARLTEVGTLALALKSAGDDRRWEVHLNVRSKMRAAEAAAGPNADDPGTGADPRKLQSALELAASAFNPHAANPIAPASLARQLEAALEQARDAWPAAVARKLADTLLDLAPQRERSAEHEARWLNMTGFLLRPGFGFLADEERMRKLYNATRNGLYFVSDPNCRIEWWVLWRRVSGGLKEDHERELFYRLQPFLTEDRDVTRRGGWPRPTKGEVPEMWRAAASLELLDAAQKKIMGAQVLKVLEKDGVSGPLVWALGRLGARQPAHAAAHRVVPPGQAEAWLKSLLALEWGNNPLAVFAAVSLARRTGDRTRDIGESLRGKTLERLKKSGAAGHDLAAVRDITALESQDRKLIFGDALPPALRLEE